VAFGLLVQLVLENAPMEEITMVLDFYSSVGLPIALDEIGIESATDEGLRRAADAASGAGKSTHNEPFEVSSDMVLAAIKAANAIGIAYRDSK